jgi:hypothetical protein
MALAGRVFSDLRVGACTQAARPLRPDVNLLIGLGHEQRLRIRVDGDELAAAKTGLDHAVDGVRAPTADADDLDHGQISARRISHCLPSSLKLSLSVGGSLRPSRQTVKCLFAGKLWINSKPQPST